MTTLQEQRYLILAEGYFGHESSKTANSAIRYIPDRVVGVIDARHAGRVAADVLGFGGGLPIVASLEEGLQLTPSALLIGIAPQGGQLPAAWRAVIHRAMEAGLNVVSGLHYYLTDDEEIAAAARARGVQIWDLRKPPRDLPVSLGRARLVDPLVVLTVGTDCNIGKMTAALQIRGELEKRGARARFAPTGQTGILIEGWGIAVDAVVADFLAGAAERIVLEAAEGSDIVLVEGQGSLIHPGYSAVTLGLLHGSLPDVMILCHQPSRRCIFGGNGAYQWMPIPSLTESIRINESAIAPLKEARVVGISLNTYDLSDSDARAAIARAEGETGLPATDPVRYGAAPLAEAILSRAAPVVRSGSADSASVRGA